MFTRKITFLNIFTFGIIFFIVLPIRIQWNGLFYSIGTHYDNGFVRGLHIPSTNIDHPQLKGHFSPCLVLGTFCSCVFKDSVNTVLVQMAMHTELTK